jgi:hypothetical protein
MYGATGSIEGGDNAVTGVAAVSFNHLARQLIVTVQQPTPVLIAHFGKAASCVNLFAPPIGVRVAFMRQYAGQYSKPRHSAIGRKLPIGMITIWVCQQSVSSEIPAIVLADTGSLKDSSATTKSGSVTKRYRC